MLHDFVLREIRGYNRQRFELTMKAGWPEITSSRFLYCKNSAGLAATPDDC